MIQEPTVVNACPEQCLESTEAPKAWTLIHSKWNQYYRSRLLIYLFLTFSAVFLNLPFYYMCITSLKPSSEMAQIEPSLWVYAPTLESINRLLHGASFLQAGLNSAIVALLTTVGNLLFCPMAGYAFAKLKFPAKDHIFLFLLSSMMIPGAVLLVPGFLLARDLGWINSFAPLVVPGLGSVFFIYLSRQFMTKIPDILIQAARLDGCSELRIYFQIIFPLCRPLFATIGILTFLGSWNSFIGPMVYLFDEDKYTLPLVISMLQGRFKTQESIQMAGSMLSILPVLLLFFLLQRQIIDSFANSGLKE
jgi:multiple sugar transport system permease protein